MLNDDRWMFPKGRVLKPHCVKWLGCLFACVSVAFVTSASAAERLDVVIGYLERLIPPPPTLSNLDPVPDDLGWAGAKLGVAGNSTTGKFLDHHYSLSERRVPEADDFMAEARDLLAVTPFLIVNAPAEDLLRLADLSEAKQALLFNVSAREITLRDTDCRANVLHTMPSRLMLSDALAQFAVKKRWTNWVMIEGSRDGDKALGNAFERSAAKFRIDLKSRKTWAFDADMRRNAASEVPLFTQDFPEHDMLLVADEAADFAPYLPYNTWIPRPLAGSVGLMPLTWSSVVEQHGAAQLQSRFRDLAGRTMRSVDYAAWAAARVIGEAVTRTNAREPDVVKKYILSDDFELGGFKGRKLTFRSWNGQLRQPIPLAQAKAVTALAPVEGFLHQRNELDTLGLDQPESRCRAFGEKNG